MINPGLQTNLRDVLAQGHDVGDVDTDANGNSWRWSGVSWESQGGGGGGGGSVSQAAPPFNFDWTKARQQAYDELTPYYQQKLDLAKGDVELAKKYIEQDYQRGLRYTTDTYNTQEKYNKEEGAANLAQEAITQKEETRNAQASANKAGVYVGEMERGATGAAPTSSYYQEYIGNPMSERQRLRTEAIKRAVQKQSELAGITNTRDVGELESTRSKGLNAQDTSLRNYQIEAGQEQKEKAYNVNAPLKYQEDYAKYRAANNLG